MIDIIIPFYNQSALTVACIQSIKEHTKSHDYRIILIDNGSLAEDHLAVAAALRPSRRLIVRNRTNLGFVKAINQGLSLATAAHVVLLNNDTEVCADWIDKLLMPFQRLDVGAVGPLSSSIDSWQGKHSLKSEYRVLNSNAMLAFFCICIRLDVIQDVGLLDEEFGVGLADDDDYCFRMQSKGYRLALAQNLVIKHHHRTTFKSLYSPGQIEDMTDQALDMFYKKHPEARV